MDIGNTIEMRVVNSLAQINRSSWEMIRDKNELVTDPDYLNGVETSEVIDCEYRYFEFYDNSRLICAMSGYILMNDAALFHGSLLKKITALVRTVVPGFLKTRTLEIGSPINLGLPVLISERATPEQLDTAVDLLKSYARRNRVKALLIRDFMAERKPFEVTLPKTGFICVLNLPNSLMKMEWDSFQDYLSCLKSRYRQHARKRIRKKDSSKIETVITCGRDGLKSVGDFVDLFRHVLEKSEEYKREFIGEKYHRAMFENLRDCNYWLQYFKDGRLVFFAHFIVYKKKHGDSVCWNGL